MMNSLTIILDIYSFRVSNIFNKGDVMNKIFNISSLALLFSISVYFTIFTYPYPHFDYQTLLIIVAFIALIIFPHRMGFLVALVPILVIGFAYLGISFFETNNNVSQLHLIVHHIFIALTLVLSWLLFSQVKTIKDENESLKNKLESLQKYDIDTLPDLLTVHEFANRAEILLIGMKRRNEKAYLLKIRAQNNTAATEASFSNLIDCVLKTVRVKYDLVTMPNKETIYVFLQNTNESGASIAINRLKEKLTSDYYFSELPFRFELSEVESSDEINMLIGLRNKEVKVG